MPEDDKSLEQEIADIVRDVVANELSKLNIPSELTVELKNPPETPKMPEFDTSSLETALAEGFQKLLDKKAPELPETDFTKLEMLLEEVASRIKDIHIPDTNNTLEAILNALKEQKPAEINFESVNEGLARLEEVIKKKEFRGGGAIGPSKKYLQDTTGVVINPATKDNQKEYRLQHAIPEVQNTYGDTVSLDDKKKTLRKFGRNGDVGSSFETVWRTGGDETYPTTNAIDKFSSSDMADTQSIVVEGHTISSGVLTFVTQTVTLQGQTETALTTPLARATRLYNNGTTDFAGTVYVYEDDTVDAGVPQTASKIHLTVSGGNQSEKASTSISNTDYWFVTEFLGFVFNKTSEIVEFEIQIREVGTTNKVFRRIFETTAQNGQPTIEQFDPVIIIPKNHDVRIRAVSDGTGTVDVGAALNGYLALVT